MNGPGNEFFSCARFAHDQNSCAGRGHGVNGANNGLITVPFAYHVPDVLVEADLVFQVELFGSETLLYFSQLPKRE